MTNVANVVMIQYEGVCVCACLWMLRPAWMVTGCMCGAVSCRAAEMGANVKKKPHCFKTPTIQRHVTILQLKRPHHFTVGLYG